MTAAAVARAAPAGEAFATEIDASTYGEYRVDASVPRPAFTGRVETPIAAGRYHLYLSWASIASNHVAILRRLLGVDDGLSISYVDSLRDGRGWAFRRRSGADPVNGFTLLRQAYETSDPDFAGEVRVPLLWDRRRGKIVSDDAESIIADLFDGVRSGPFPRLATGPAVGAEVERLSRAFDAELDPVAALREPARRPIFRQALRELDARLSGRTYLVGDRLSDADVRLWVRLARLDAGPNAFGAIGPRLDAYPHLWRWARSLYDLAAFRSATDFRRFAPSRADLPPWNCQG